MHKQAFILHTESHTKAWHIYKNNIYNETKTLKHTIMEKQITLEQAGTACGKVNSMIKRQPVCLTLRSVFLADIILT